MLRVGLCGGVVVEADGRRLPDALLAGRQGRLVFAYLVCARHRSVSREELAELLWGERLPSSWASSLSAVVSKLRRLLSEAGLDGASLASAFGSYRLHLPEDATVDWEAVAAAVERAEDGAQQGDVDAAVKAARFAQEIARRGFLSDDCAWVDIQRARLHDLNVRAVQAEAAAYLRGGNRGRAVVSAREALALDELREESYRLLMQAMAAAGERGEALRVWERCRTLLEEELGTDPAPETEAVYLSILGESSTSPPAPLQAALPSGVVTFLLTDIVGSTVLWERNPAAMAAALLRHDHLVAETAQAHGGVLLKAKLEGDATVSVFPRASAGALAALALREVLTSEPWPEGAAPNVRMALHTGEAIERDGDYFGPALNRAARLRALAGVGQILVSQAVAEVILDHLPTSAALRSLGERQLRGLTRGEHVFELAPIEPGAVASDLGPVPLPPLPAVLCSREPFVGRGPELERLAIEWATAAAGTARATFIAGEPGVGKTRLAAEWARRAHDQGALVLYGRCDEELGAPYQPFAEALRFLAPHLGPDRLRPIRGIEELTRLVPELADLVPGLGAPSQADPDTERYLLFDALVRLLATVSSERPLLVVVDDLHWAAKPTLLLLRHLLRSGDGTRLQIVGTYRSTDLVRTHPLAGILTDLHRDGTAERLALTGFDVDEVTSYLSAAGHDDAHLGAALSTVTSGNPFFLIEVLRHVQESGGQWDRSTLPQGVREAVGRRLSNLSGPANDALLVAAVAGSRFTLDLVEHVLERDLLDAVEEARRAGLVLEEPDGRFRFNHALVRQSLLAEVASVKRVRLHQRVAAALEADTAVSGDGHLADLARHYFECAFAGGAAKAVDYSRRAGEHAMARLAYEEAADLFDQGLQAADVDGSGASDDDRAELLLAACEALLAAGDPTAAITVVGQLERVARGSPRLSAWARCFAGQLAVLTHPERLDATAQDVAAAARQFAQLDDAEGEAKAHTVRASCLARLGRIADCEAALDQALTAGRRAGNPRRVNAVLAGAPVAALWGPSAVPRASGRCLDVVRVLRITTGSAAVEAIAFRCQAVLEALRGRTDAARRMLGSAQRSLEELGHTHGLLEIDLFSGIVELVAERPADAEVVLRSAYDGFVARGVGADAAQAAALLARAVLAQGRVEEAIALTQESERLAGVDLKAGISWRSVRAEALARQGRSDEAREAAVAAVALADATDALIDQADAHLATSLVLRAAGDDRNAEREARRAADLYERKGATARVAAVQAHLGATAEVLPSLKVPVSRRRVRPNLATATLTRGAGPWDERSFEEWAGLAAEDYVEVDHRTQVTIDRQGYLRALRMWAQMDRFTMTVEPMASLGERHGLARMTAHMEGTPLGVDRVGPAGLAEVVLLSVARTDQQGRLLHCERFDPQDLLSAMARLVELHAEDELDPERRDGRSRIAGYFRDTTPFAWSDDAVLVDHRLAGLGTLRGHDQIRAAGRALREVAGDVRKRINDVLGSTEQVLFFDVTTEGFTDSGEPFELTMLAMGEFDADGQQRRAEWFESTHLEQALARFDELTASSPSARHRRFRPNRASACLPGGPMDDEAYHRAMAAQLRDDFVHVDHRMHLELDRTAVIATWREMAKGQHPTVQVTTLATAGDRHCLSRNAWRTRAAVDEARAMGPSEVSWLNVLRSAADGRVVRLETFDPDQLNVALARLIELHADDELPLDQREAAYRLAEMFRNPNTRWSEDAVLVDHRPSSLGTLHGREAIAGAAAALREVAGDQSRRISDVLGWMPGVSLLEIVTEGRVDGGGPFEITVLSIQVADDGLCPRQEWYAPEQIDEALARFDELAAPPRAPLRRIRPNLASEFWRDGPIDEELVNTWAARLRDDFVCVDHRLQLELDRTQGLETWRLMAAVGDAQLESTALATLGDCHSLHRTTWRTRDAAAVSGLPGTSEVTWLGVMCTDTDGRGSFLETFEADQLHVALARLVELHADDELPADQHDWRYAVAAAIRSAKTRWSDDAVLVDHRPGSLGTLTGLHAIAAAGDALRDASAGDLRRRIVDVLGLTERVLLLEMVTEGSVDGGGAFEMPVLCITLVDEPGLCTRQEWYLPEQLHEALSRFDELAAARP